MEESMWPNIDQTVRYYPQAGKQQHNYYICSQIFLAKSSPFANF